MKNIKNYNDFILEGKHNKYAYMYIYNQISEKEFNDYLFSELMNESIIDNIKKVYNDIKERLLDTFFTFIVEAQKTGVKILTKVLNIASKWITWLKKFHDKHPTLTKVIVIFIIMVILMILSSGTAHAADIVNNTSGKVHLNTTHIDACNGAIHFIDVNSVDLKNITGADDQTLLQAKTYIKDMMDGKLDSPEMITKQAKAVGETALKTINNLINQANNNNDVGMMKKIANLIGEGGKHVWGGNIKL